MYTDVHVQGYKRWIFHFIISSGFVNPWQSDISAGLYLKTYMYIYSIYMYIYYVYVYTYIYTVYHVQTSDKKKNIMNCFDTLKVTISHDHGCIKHHEWWVHDTTYPPLIILSLWLQTLVGPAVSSCSMKALPCLISATQVHRMCIQMCNQTDPNIYFRIKDL